MVSFSQVRNIERLNEEEIRKGLTDCGSWHDQYKDSPYVFVGGLPFDLNEGDISAIFAQYGKLNEVFLVRDKDTGKSRGFAFVGYEDQRSTILAVDNFNGIKVLGRTLRVDHALNFKSQKERDAENERKKGEKEAKISEMADEIFKNAVGQIFQMPNDYTEQTMPSPKSIGGDLEEREIRRRLKAERRAKETDEERRLRKLRSANQSGA